jgi:hypothetical protein
MTGSPGRGATDLIDGGPGRDRLSGGPGADRIASNDRRNGCFQVDVKLATSANGGSTWTQPRQLNAFPMLPAWMADTSLGRMLGDYVSVSWSRGRPVPVFSLAAVPAGDVLRQAIFATTRLG